MASVAIGRVMAGGPGKGNLELLVDVTPFFQVRWPDVVRGWSVAPLFVRWNLPAIGNGDIRCSARAAAAFYLRPSRYPSARRPSSSWIRRGSAFASRKATGGRGSSAIASSTSRMPDASSRIQARISISSIWASAFSADGKRRFLPSRPTIVSIWCAAESLRQRPRRASRAATNPTMPHRCHLHTVLHTNVGSAPEVTAGRQAISQIAQKSRDSRDRARRMFGTSLAMLTQREHKAPRSFPCGCAARAYSLSVLLHSDPCTHSYLPS